MIWLPLRTPRFDIDHQFLLLIQWIIVLFESSAYYSSQKIQCLITNMAQLETTSWTLQEQWPTGLKGNQYRKRVLVHLCWNTGRQVRKEPQFRPSAHLNWYKLLEVHICTREALLFHSDSQTQIEKDKFVYVCPELPCNALCEILQYRINFSSLKDTFMKYISTCRPWRPRI